MVIVGAGSLCGRCHEPIPEGTTQRCWYCQGSLCYLCWDEHGHCGEPAAVAMNEASRAWKLGDPQLPRPWERAEVDAAFDAGVLP